MPLMKQQAALTETIYGDFQTTLLLLLTLLLLTACTLAWAASSQKRGYHEPSFAEKITVGACQEECSTDETDVERQKKRFWLMVRDAKDFLYSCYYMML
eukprot:525839-Pelagomonas_calceolata.AAC.8